MPHPNPSQTVRAKAIRALLAAVDAVRTDDEYTRLRDGRLVLTNDDGEPALAVYQIVNVVVDSVIESLAERK